MKRFFCLILCSLLVLQGCDNSSDDVASNGGTTGTGDGGTRLGYALLGPVVGATVHVYKIEDVSLLQCQTLTSTSNDLDQAGVIQLPEACIEDNQVYLLEVIRGEDIDADDDRQIDTLATAVDGKFRAILTSDQFSQPGWKVSALTEAAFQSVIQHVQSGRDQAFILDELDRVAPLLIDEDVNLDGVIDYDDVVFWHAAFDKQAPSNTSSLQNILGDIHDGTNITGQVQSLQIEHADTLSQANHIKVRDHIAYLGLETSVQVRSVDPQGSPFLISSFSTGFIVDLALQDNFLIVALGTEGIQVLDISNPYQPGLVKELPVHADMLREVAGELYFAAEDDSKVYHLDIDPVTEPVLAVAVSLGNSDSIKKMTSSETLLALAFNDGSDSHSHIYEFQTGQLAFVKELSARSVNAIALENDDLYLLLENAISTDLVKFDISQRDNLVELNRQSYQATDMLLDDENIYLVDGNNFLRIRKSSLELIDSITVPGLEMSLDNNFIYLSAQHWGICRWWVGSQGAQPGPGTGW